MVTNELERLEQEAEQRRRDGTISSLATPTQAAEARVAFAHVLAQLGEVGQVWLRVEREVAIRTLADGKPVELTVRQEIATELDRLAAALSRVAG